MIDDNETLETVRRLAPFDHDGLITFWSDSGAKTALSQELTQMTVAGPAAGRPAPSRTRVPRRGFVAVAGTVAVAVVLAVAPGLVLDTGSRAFAIRELPNGVLEIEMSSEFRDGHTLAAELREYGVESDIELVTASPSVVGGTEVFNQTGGDYIPEGMELPPDGSTEWVMTLDPALFRERLTIRIYVEPEAGQPYTTSAEVFSPGEVLGGLHCALGEPVRAADVVPYLDELGLTAIWEVVSPTADPSTTRHTEVDEVPEGEIVSGYPVDASTVRFNVRLDGVTLPAAWDSPLSRTPCTANQAAAWS